TRSGTQRTTSPAGSVSGTSPLRLNGIVGFNPRDSVTRPSRSYWIESAGPCSNASSRDTDDTRFVVTSSCSVVDSPDASSNGANERPLMTPDPARRTEKLSRSIGIVTSFGFVTARSTRKRCESADTPSRDRPTSCTSGATSERGVATHDATPRPTQDRESGGWGERG